MNVFFNFSFFIFFFVILMALIVPILIGFYVYKDASSRRMNAILWALIAVFAPTYIGLLLYLVIRNDYSNLQCPTCQFPVKPTFTACPSCGTKLKHSCEQCGHPIEAGWKVCPSCSSTLAFQTPVRSPMVVGQSTASSKFLILALLIPLGIVGLLFLLSALRYLVR